MIPRPRLNWTEGVDNIVLVSCGSFSPVTNMHLRMFEDAKLFLEENGSEKKRVLGGYVSPVHDAYGKSSLVSGLHRMMMCEKAVQRSSWIQVSTWELQQNNWVPTVDVLENMRLELSKDGKPVHVKLLCGADLLESFAEDGIWSEDSKERIVRDFGLVCIKRSGSQLDEITHRIPQLAKYASNVTIVPPLVTNTISSTLVRNLISSGKSAAYLVPDEVLYYIEEQKLYGCVPFSQTLFSRCAMTT